MTEPLPPFRRWTRASKVRAALVVGLAVGAPAGCYGVMIRMPGTSHSGALPPLGAADLAVGVRLEADLRQLAGDIGERNTTRPEKLAEAARLVEGKLALAGYAPARQEFVVDGVTCANVEAEKRGQGAPDEIVIIGAHYDSARGTPGANDNGTGTVAMLELARAFAVKATRRTVRFVAFVNEEPPYFATPRMGSAHYAARSTDRKETIVAMLSLETMGAYYDRPGSQKYPFPLGLLYPDRGNFVVFVGNVASRELVREAVGTFRATTPFPSEGAAVPERTTGVDWSDHRAFWAAGYPALMVTDTAIFRYAEYHRPGDTPDKVDVDGLARVTTGLVHVIERLAQ